MEYRAEFFEADSYQRPDNGAAKVYFSGFYEVFDEGNFRFGMDPAFKDSIMERFAFYENEILKEESYPLVTDFGVVPTRPDAFACLNQVLGLPLYFMCKHIPPTVDSKCLEEIKNSLVFRDKYARGMGFLRDFERSPDILKTNLPCVINLVNYLIGRGLYFYNIEKLLSDETDSFPNYPVYAHFDRLPASFRKPIDPVEIFLSFRLPGTNYTREQFEKFCSILKKKPEDAFRFAFEPCSYEKDDIVQDARACLRDYFSAMIKMMVNDYFREYFHVDYFFPPTVLEHDTGLYPFANRFLSVGANFMMTAKCHIVIDPKTGSAKEEVGEYGFCQDDRKGIAFAYDCVHKWFRDQKREIYPALFVRLMGLPYPAYSKVVYFDYESGTGEEFAALFDYGDFDILSYPLPPICLDDYGEIRFLDAPGNSLYNHYILARHGFFLLFWDIVPDQLDFTLMLSKENVPIYEKMKEDGAFFQEKIQRQNEIGGPSEKKLTGPLRFFGRDGNGNYPQIASFLTRLANGEFFQAILADLFPLEEDAKKTIAQFLFHCLCQYMLYGNEEAHAMYFARDRGCLSEFAERERILFVGQDYQGILTARGIVFERDGEYFFPDFEKENLRKAEEFHNRFCHFQYFDAHMFYGQKEYEWNLSLFNMAVFVTGLRFSEIQTIPILFIGSVVDQLMFRDFSDLLTEKTKKALLTLPATLDMLVHRKIFVEKGIYVPGTGIGGLSLLALDRKQEDIATYLDPQRVAIQVANTNINSDSLDEDPCFEKLDDVLVSTQQEDCFPNHSLIGSEYLDSIRHTLYLRALSELVEDSLPKKKEDVEGKAIFDVRTAVKSVQKQIPLLPNCQMRFFRDDRTGLFFSVGSFFSAVSKDGRKFFFDPEDRKALQRVYDVVRSLPTFTRRRREDKAYRLGLLGLPPVFLPKSLEMPDFNFAKKPLPPSRYFPDESWFSLAQAKEKPFVSTFLKNRALREGFLLLDDQDILSPAFRNPFGLTEHIDLSYRLIQEFFIVLDKNLEGSCKAFFLPKRRTFETYLERFLKAYSYTNLSSEFLFYSQEELEYLYDKDPTFLRDAVNALHLYDLHAFLEKRLKTFHLPQLEKVFPQSATYDFIAFFLLFLEQEYLVWLWEATRREVQD